MLVQVCCEKDLEKVDARVNVDQPLERSNIHDCAVGHAHLSFLRVFISLEFAEDVAVEDELAVDGVVILRTDIEDQNLYGILVLEAFHRLKSSLVVLDPVS